MNEICVICGAPATTREHKVKHSLLKATFEGTDKIYAYYFDGKKAIMQSPKNKHFTYGKNLCQTCNNSLTQPYDKAYDKFLLLLEKNKTKIFENNCIDLTTLTKKEPEDLFRYFSKEFSCKINDEQLKIPDSVVQTMQGKQYAKNLLLLFFINQEKKHKKIGHEVIHSEIDEWRNDTTKFLAYHISLGWLIYITYYTNLPKKVIQKINNHHKIGCWYGKRKKIVLNDFSKGI